MILTHYFPSDLLQISNLDELSKSITKYSPEKQKKIAEQLSNYSGRALRRFDPDQFENYIKRRNQTEKWLYNAFLEIGGYPVSQHPFYCVLGENKYLYHDFGENTVALQLDTAEISEYHLSFTLGDSVGIYFSSAPKRIYTLKQISSLLADTTYIKKQMQHLNRYHQYIEAQLWSTKYIPNAKIIKNYPLLIHYIFISYIFQQN